MVVASILIMAGCGLVYTQKIVPYDINMTETPIVMRSHEGDIKHLSYSLVDFRWETNAVGDIARENGIETIYFMDMENF